MEGLTLGTSVYIYSAVLQRLLTPSNSHTPLPSIAPFAHPQIASTHSCIYCIPSFQVLRGRPRFFRPSFFQLIMISGNPVQFLLSACPHQMSFFFDLYHPGTLTEVFPCFSSVVGQMPESNSSKTGHGPHISSS